MNTATATAAAQFLVRLLRPGMAEGHLRLTGAEVMLDAEAAADLVRTGRAVLVNDADLSRLLASTARRQDVPHLRLVKR